jgi:hypothetical protein
VQRLSGSISLAPGRTSLGLRFVSSGQYRGTAFLTAGDADIASGEITRTGTIFPPDAGLTCGEDRGLTVTSDYDGPFPFSGTIHSVTVSAEAPQGTAPEREFNALLAQQ